MAKTKSSEREKARKIYIKSGRTLKNKEIAAKIGVSASLIAKWKSQDKWDSESLPKEPSKSKKKGGQKGNKNADKNAGGGAPENNTNAQIHGGYSKIYWDVLTEEERAMLEDMPRSEEDMMIDQIKLLSVRERRLMQIINYYRTATTDEGKPKTQFTVSVNTNKENKVFHSPEDEALYKEIARKKIEEEKISYLFDKVQISQTSESAHNIIQRLERELTSAQNAKTRAIAELARLHEKPTNNSDEDENNLFQQIAQSMKGGASNAV